MAGGAMPEYQALLPSVLRADPDPDSITHPVRRSLRDWLVDLLVFLVAVAATAALGVEDANRGIARTVLAVDLGLAGLGCLVLWWRRRWPVGVAVAIFLLSIYSETAFGAAMIALFTVAVHRRFVVLAWTTGALLASFLLFGIARPDAPADPGSAIFGLLVVGGVLAWGMFVRARRQLVLSLRERARRAEAEQQLRVSQARQAERARIAREMHDVLAHRISLLSLHAGALAYRPDAPAEEIARACEIIRTSAHQALEDLREIIGVLREDAGREAHPDRPQPTLADLAELVDESRRAGMRVQLDDQVADLAKVPAGVGRSAYRIVQEGLTNARKHAHGAIVHVTVDGAPGRGITIELRNPRSVRAAEPLDGATSSPGAATIPGAGSGLVGLAERASLAGGRLEHGFTPAGEFRLWAWLPWPA